MLENKIKEIEDNLVELGRRPTNNGGISPRVPYPEFKTRVANINHNQFTQKALEHYFISRVLWKNYLNNYALFFAHQCIEQYLKSFLKMHGSLQDKHLSTHDLETLLDDCEILSKKENHNNSFILSEHIELIVKKFNPFDEWVRYPAWRNGPEGMSYGGGSSDIEYLDYFVFKMRKLFKEDIFNELFKHKNRVIPGGPYIDIKVSTGEIDSSRSAGSDLYKFFEEDNINTDTGDYVERVGGNKF